MSPGCTQHAECYTTGCEPGFVIVGGPGRELDDATGRGRDLLDQLMQLVAVSRSNRSRQ